MAMATAGKKQRVLRISEPCCQDCWHTASLTGYNLTGTKVKEDKLPHDRCHGLYSASSVECYLLKIAHITIVVLNKKKCTMMLGNHVCNQDTATKFSHQTLIFFQNPTAYLILKNTVSIHKPK